jgi:hypothetical protein
MGDQVLVTSDGDPYLDITVSDAHSASHYTGSSGFTDQPDTPGYVYISAKVTYLARADGATYNPFDWEAYAAGQAMGSKASTIYGPKPELHSGILSVGRTASGYVVWEVPAKGEVRIAYGASAAAGRGAVFEVVIRPS